MNNRMYFGVLTALTIVGGLTVSSAYALEKPYPGIDGDIRDAAEEILLNEVPVSIWTDQTVYNHNSIIKVTGQVANVYDQAQVTLTVTSPLNSIVSVAQIQPNADGTFETTLNTQGDLWKYDGIYVIKVNYGSTVKSNKVFVELQGGQDYRPIDKAPDKECGRMEISADGNCIPFSISGGTVTGASINTENKSIIVNIKADSDGMLTINPSESIIEGISLVFVNGEEWDDVEMDGNKITVMFLADAEEIEFIGTWVIPEFGTIAAMILAVAIISIIAISARSRLSIMPRY